MGGVRWDRRSRTPETQDALHTCLITIIGIWVLPQTPTFSTYTHTHTHTHTQVCPSRRSKSNYRVGLEHRKGGVLTEPHMKFRVCFPQDLLRGGWISSPGCLLVCEEERLRKEIFFLGYPRGKTTQRGWSGIFLGVDPGMIKNRRENSFRQRMKEQLSRDTVGSGVQAPWFGGPVGEEELVLPLLQRKICCFSW